MKKFIGIIFLTLTASAAFAQISLPTELEGMVANSAAGAKAKVNMQEKQDIRFAPKNTRDPFLSREEVDTIQKARDAEQKRIDDNFAFVEEQHRQASLELSKSKYLSNESYRKWNASAYKYNPSKHRYEFDEKLGRSADVPKYIKER